MPKKKSLLSTGFMALACLVFLCPAGSVSASQPGGSELDAEQLKAGIAERVDNMLARQQPGNGSQRPPVTGENIRLKQVEPVSVAVDGREITLYAVKAGLEFSGGNAAEDIMMVVDRTGRLEVNVSQVNTGRSPFQAAKDRLKKTEIDPSLGKTIYSGSGDQELVLVSSPFCPYCRKAFAYFAEHTDQISEWRIIHMTYPGQSGSNAAVWAMSDGMDAVEPLELMRFAYTELEPPENNVAGKRSQEVIAQFMEKFSELKERWGTAEQARYFLKGKYADKARQQSRRAGNELKVQATPKAFINGIPVTGWAPARYADLLNTKKESKKEALNGQRQ